MPNRALSALISRDAGGWQDAGAGRSQPHDSLDVERLSADHPELVRDEILVPIFLAISNDEVTAKTDGTEKYAAKKTLTIAFSGAESKDPYHCTDLIMNSGWMAGFDMPTNVKHPKRFWRRTADMLETVQAGKDPRVQQVPVGPDDPATAVDESKASIRPGDVMVWGPKEGSPYGHHMLVLEQGTKGAQLVVREAGVKVIPRGARPMDPDERDQAIYRFTKFDVRRVSNRFTTDKTYRQRFKEAFDKCTLPAAEKNGYRR